ncbi:MAG TPA: hypothetical protein VNB90_17170 [Cytophagaceae bacterium]|nr:hypothetical protein [Cytophagaceae bacterium]
MENYKIKRNPKKLTDEQINRHKDFGKLLTDQQKLYRYKDATRPLYKNWGLMGMMILVGVVLLMIMLDSAEDPALAETEKDSIAVIKADTELINPVEQSTTTSSQNLTQKGTSEVSKPAIQNTPQVVYETFTFPASAGAVLYTSSGNRLLIPAQAFSKNNKTYPAEKLVVLRYRELSSATEAGLKAPSFETNKIFELTALDESFKETLTISKPLILEILSTVKESDEKLYVYASDKKNWEFSEKENIAYRFTIQANETQFPELVLLKELAWEIPAEIGKPSDFNYIFNHSWKGFSFKTTDKKELAVKSPSGSSFKGILDVAPLLGDPQKDLALREAFYTVYNFKTKKIGDASHYEKALVTIGAWKTSPAGKEYFQWLRSSAEKQFDNAEKISKFKIVQTGFVAIGYTLQSASSLASKRILLLEKYPERVSQENENMNQD